MAVRLDERNVSFQSYKGLIRAQETHLSVYYLYALVVFIILVRNISYRWLASFHSLLFSLDVRISWLQAYFPLSEQYACIESLL